MTNDQPLVGADRIAITKDMVLRHIMYHEFPHHTQTSTGKDSLGLDEAPLLLYLKGDKDRNIKGLTDAQLTYLLSYKPPAGMTDRLVVFITKFPRGQAGKLMGADKCDWGATKMVSNASFAAFHCRSDRDPTLVCYTEEMCLASRTDMPAYYKSRNKSVDEANVLKICAFVPMPTHANTIWNRICKKDGTDIMPGSPADKFMPNSVHGEINTVGCWMLFRNFNWPKARFEKFEEAYRKPFRQKNGDVAALRVRLADPDLGYGDSQAASDKALFWDHNFSYSRFLRYVAGIDYFSTEFWRSLYNTDGEHFHPTASQEYLDQVPPGKNAHNADSSSDGLAPINGFDFNVPDGLLVNNRMGFTPQKYWAPNRGAKVTDVLNHSWADALLFDP